MRIVFISLVLIFFKHSSILVNSEVSLAINDDLDPFIYCSFGSDLGAMNSDKTLVIVN